MDAFWRDLRYGVRTLLKTPGFAVIGIVTLALGIGANTAIFSVINAVLLRPLPFKDQDRLVVLSENRRGETEPVSGHEFAAWSEQNNVFDRIAAYGYGGFTLTSGGEPIAVRAVNVSSEFFSVFGIEPAVGRLFTSGEDQAGRNRVVVLSQKLWRSRFDGDSNILGQTILLSDEPYTVVGVTPSMEDFDSDVWVPMDLPLARQRVGAHTLVVVARLKPAMNLEHARQDLDAIAERVEEQYPEDNKGHRVNVASCYQEIVGDVRPALLVLMGAVGIVLLIACANVANLLLARAAARQKELAIKSALGAGRWRLVRQLLTESLVLASIGGFAGVLLAMWIIALLSKLTAVRIPRVEQVNIDGRVLAVTVALSLIAGIVSGVMPALRGSSPQLGRWLSERDRASSGPGRRRLGAALVIVEVALSLILLVGAGLMINSFLRLVNVNPGFDPRNATTFNVSLPATRYAGARQRMQFFNDLIARTESIQGVQYAGAASLLPLNVEGGDSDSPFAIEGRPPGAPAEDIRAGNRVVTPDYFKAMGIPLVSGRFFDDSDARVALPVMRWWPGQPYPPRYNEPQPAPVVIINQTMATRYWPGEDPLGRRISIIASPWLTIVGVVGDVHHKGLDLRPGPEMYLVHLQEPQSAMQVVVRSDGSRPDVATAIREQVRALDPGLPVTITPMEDLVSSSVGRARFYVIILGAFGAMALLLAVVGLYGVVSNSVTQRTREIGIRVALGAKPGDVLKHIVGGGMTLVLAGLLVGIPMALALTRLLETLLFEVKPADPLTFIGFAALLALVAFSACYLPARRATRVDPMVALRSE